MISRRHILSAPPALLAAPAIVRASSLMRVVGWVEEMGVSTIDFGLGPILIQPYNNHCLHVGDTVHLMEDNVSKTYQIISVFHGSS
jgi:hypothetical protein